MTIRVFGLTAGGGIGRPKKSASRREVLKKAGAITAPTSGASFAFAGDPEKAPGTPAEATVSKDSLGPSLGPRAVRPVGPGQTSRRRSRNRPEGARSRITFQRIDETNPQGRGAVGISAVGTPSLIPFLKLFISGARRLSEGLVQRVRRL